MTNPPEATKTCSNRSCERAGQQLPLSDFGRNDSTASGRSYHCRKCCTRIQSEWKKAHPEEAKKWRRAYTERNKAKHRALRASNEPAGTPVTE